MGRALARALGTDACRLRSVNLSGNRITSAGVGARRLASCEPLTSTRAREWMPTCATAIAKARRRLLYAHCASLQGGQEGVAQTSHRSTARPTTLVTAAATNSRGSRRV